MKKYIDLIKRQTSQAFVVEFIQVPKEENEHVDPLAKMVRKKHGHRQSGIIIYAIHLLLLKWMYM